MKLIINADDYGWSETCSKAIAECFEKDMISSTTMCANGYYFDEAIILAKVGGFADRIGIHFNLTEGKPLTDEMSKSPKFCLNGLFNPTWSRYAPLSKNEKSIVESELRAQVQKYLSSGMSIHHIDSHHHIHTAVNIFPIVQKLSTEYDFGKIRISRNVGNMSAMKKAFKGLFNRKLVSRQMNYSDVMGSYKDLAASELNCNRIAECMVHPDYSTSGELIDRENADYSCPVGKKMADELQALNDKFFVF